MNNFKGAFIQNTWTLLNVKWLKIFSWCLYVYSKRKCSWTILRYIRIGENEERRKRLKRILCVFDNDRVIRKKRYEKIMTKCLCFSLFRTFHCDCVYVLCVGKAWLSTDKYIFNFFCQWWWRWCVHFVSRNCSPHSIMCVCVCAYNKKKIICV